MPAARPFRLLGQSQLAFLHDQLAQRIAAWAGDWVRESASAAPAAATIELQPAERTKPLAGPWLTVSQGGQTCHVHRVAGHGERLLFGADAARQGSVLAAEAVRSGWADLARRCISSPGTPIESDQAPPDEAWRTASSAVFVRAGWPAGSIELLLDSGAVARWLAGRPRAARPPTPRLADLRTVVGPGRLVLQAWAGQAEIDIGTLQSLAVGDVVPLDLTIDQPLRLQLDGRPTAVRAYLGYRDQQRVIRLTAQADAADVAR